MFEKRVKQVILLMLALMVIIPICTTNISDDVISEVENRKLAPFPHIHREDGSLNIEYPHIFDSWIDDHIGMRSQLVIQNAKIQYYLFHVVSNNSDVMLGPNGEFNYITPDIIKSYQRFDLLSNDELDYLAEGFQAANDYLERRNIQLYYFQCWDKHTIYPEYFPRSVIQHGQRSRMDQIIETLSEKTNVKVVSPKAELFAAKKNYAPYSKWGDSTHWTQRGANIGYNLIMEEINKYNNGKYRVLQEKDYDIGMADQGVTLFGGIHKVEDIEYLTIKEPKAYLTEEAPQWLSPTANKTRTIYRNDVIENEDTLLVMGDSYFDNYLYDDFAESFHKVVMVWGDFAPNLAEIVDEYQPTILIVENAERIDRTKLFADAGISLQGK